MQITVNSPNILKFGFSVVFDTNAKTITFDTTVLTVYNTASGHGALYVQGIAFGLVDQDGVEVIKMDWTNPQLPTPATQGVYVFDASYLNYAFLFQNYKISGAIKDANGMIYSVNPVLKQVCQPTDFNESGYVPGTFQILPNCTDNTIGVKEVTNFALCGQLPQGIVKAGTLSYPTGTISPVSFTSTPFSNNVVYSGEYRLHCNSVATYNLGDDVYEKVLFFTDNVFPITCANRMSDVLCCIVNLQKTREQNCDNAIGQRAAQQLDEITIPLMSGLLKEINGQDSSTESAYIKKLLNCNCGTGSIIQNEFSPYNGAISSIVITGVGGTSVGQPVINGNTKTFTVVSNIYQVLKDDNTDQAFYINVDTATANTVKYKIGFNYTNLASTILTTIGGNNTLINQLNALISATANIDLSGLDGKCIINLSQNNYFVSALLPNNNSTFLGIDILGALPHFPGQLPEVFVPGSPVLASNTSAIQTFLNGLGYGTYTVSYISAPNGYYLNIASASNVYFPVDIILHNSTGSSDDAIAYHVPFQHTNISLVSFLQAVVNYICNLSSLQVALGQNLSLCTFDYSGNVVVSNYTSTQSQGVYNNAVAAAICNLVSRINNLNSLTCSAISSLFKDYPNSPIYRIYGNDGNGNCVAYSYKQLGMAVIASINAYSDVKDAFCAIDCKVPAQCPDIASISVNMSGGNIGIYGVSWTTVPSASQTATVKYKLHSATSYTVATSNLLILPSGNLSGTSPFLITGSTPGMLYDIYITNNCGGTGFVTQFTTPVSGVYTGNFTLDNVLYLICGNNTLTTLYSSSPFGTGVIMYTDFALTTPTTGHVYILDPNTGEIYAINTSTGLVGADTGSNCNVGTPNTYRLGTNTSTVCLAPNVTRYTNGAFAVGKTLYLDAALTTPQTAYTYVVYNNIIFNINITTGVIGGSTGLGCVSSTTLTLDYTQGAWTGELSNILPFDLTLDAAQASGATVSNCLSGSETDTLSNLLLAAGNSSATQTNNGLTCTSSYFKIKNIFNVNANPVTNGGTVVINGVTITVVILHLSCSPYTC